MPSPRISSKINLPSDTGEGNFTGDFVGDSTIEGALLVAVHEREERRTRLQAELAALDGLSFAQFDAPAMEHELRSYLADWPSLAQRHPAQTRQLLPKLLPRRIRVWRELCGEEKRYRFDGEAAVGRFFSDLVGVKSLGVPNRNMRLSMPNLAHLVIPFSGEIKMAA